MQFTDRLPIHRCMIMMQTADGQNPTPRRSLVMAGGGLKVAFQAGALQVWKDSIRSRRRG
jgi:hypothetical protein